MDIMFRDVDILSISSNKSQWSDQVNVHLDDIDEDDIFDTVCEHVTPEAFLDRFILNLGDFKFSDMQKEELLEEIGLNFCKGYFDLVENE